MRDDSSSCKVPPKPLPSIVAISIHCSGWPKAESAGSSSCSARPSKAHSRSMPVDPALEALAARVAAFHITDRAMKRSQSEIEAAIASGNVDDRTRDAYVAAVRRYFSGFAKEARSHLRDVDRRLEHLNQVQFNLMAERGVAVKRIEATESVLRDLEEAAPR